MTRSMKLTVLGTILAVAMAGIAVAGGGLGKRFAQGSDRGQNPLAEAAGQVQDPKQLYARVTTRPRGERIGAKYTTKCAKGARLGTRGDTFLGTAPVTKKLRMRFRRPDVCQGTIIARMKGAGTIRVSLRAKTRR